METNELLTSLAKLESTLQEVESAKNQVKQTVDAYGALQKQIEEYTKSLDSIKTSIQGIISILHARESSLDSDARKILSSFETSVAQLLAKLSESTSGVLKELKTNLTKANEAFAKKCNDVAADFKNSTDEQLTKLQQSVLALKECITALKGLQTSVNDIFAEITQIKQGIADLKQSLETSQGAQDAILSEIKSGINSLSDELGSLKTAQDNAFNKVDAQFKANSEKMDNLAARLDKRQRLLFIVALVNTVLVIALGVLFCLK